MTKYQLFKALEPFTDEINIVVQDKEYRYLYTPNVFYTLNYDGEGQIILSQIKPEDKKAVELKV